MEICTLLDAKKYIYILKMKQMKLRHLYIDNEGCMTCLQKLKFLIPKQILKTQ